MNKMIWVLVGVLWVVAIIGAGYLNDLGSVLIVMFVFFAVLMVRQSLRLDDTLRKVDDIVCKMNPEKNDEIHRQIMERLNDHDKLFKDIERRSS